VFDPQLYFSTVLTLFVILDPPGLLPVFLGLTRGMPAEARRASARNAAVVAFGIICVFAVFGRFILDYLHITPHSRRCRSPAGSFCCWSRCSC
jgi:multiple antibiotic resistance protein